MINEKTARELAHAYLDEAMHHEDDRFVITDGKVREDDDAWYFPYQSEQFLTTGNRALYVTEGISLAVRKDGGKKTSK